MQLSWTEQLDGVIRQCDVADMAQASRQLQGRQLQRPQPVVAGSALDSRAEEIAVDYFHNIPTWLEQSAPRHTLQHVCAQSPAATYPLHLTVR